MAFQKRLYQPALSSPTRLDIPTTGGNFTLTAGTDYNVVMPVSAVQARVRLSGGRKIYVSGDVASANSHRGFQISSTATVNLILCTGQTSEVWIEGGVFLGFDGLGGQFDADAIGISAAGQTGVPDIYIINCFIDGTGRSAINAVGNVGTIYIDGLSFRTFNRGITTDVFTPGSTYAGFQMNRVSAHLAAGAAGPLFELKTAAGNLFDTWAVNDANPAAPIDSLITGVPVTP